jgi:uncharacterized protein YlxP (DUF503 family)
LDLFIAENNSLKEKRRILKRIIERVKNKFNVSIAEVGHHDVWQSAQLGLCIVGNDRRFINSSLDKAVSFIEQLGGAEIVNSEIELLNF